MNLRFVKAAALIFLFWVAPLFAYIKTTHMIAMRDNAQLATDVYLSETPGAWPAILIRTPYSKELGAEELLGVGLLVGQGYAVVVQDMRGRFASQGVDSLFLDDGWGARQDGYDTVEWIAGQAWCNGKVGTWGASALGIAQYLLAGSAPPHLVCQFVEVGATNLYTQAGFPGGTLLQNLVEGWIAGQGTTYLLPFVFGNPSYNATWERLNLESRFHVVNVPIYHWGGWHDIFTEGAINGFTGLQHNGAIGARGKQKLLMGPWTHGTWGERKQGELTFPANSTRLDFTEILRWFNYWLQGVDGGIMNEPAVQYYVMGAIETGAPGNEWRTANDWPVPGQTTSFYFHRDGNLTTTAPATAAALSYQYDPKQPVPTIGGRNLLMEAGPYDQRSTEKRSDVLLFTTPVLQQPLEVIGKIKVKLWASSSAIDTDFMAKLTDVYPDGRSMLVCDGAIRMRHRNSLAREDFMTPGEIYESEIDLWTTAMNFNAGHRLRVAITSSNTPRFDPNPNTGAPLRSDSTTLVATNTIYVDALHPSQIILPVTNGSASVSASSHDENLPADFVLGASFPNPMRDATQIAYALPRTAAVRLAIYNTLGQQVRTLVDGLVPRGAHRVKWNGRDEHTRQVAKGIYFYRLEVERAVQTQKLVVF